MTKINAEHPEIGDLISLEYDSDCGTTEIIGRLIGYRSSDAGEYVVINGQGQEETIYAPSIIAWEILSKAYEHD